MLQPLEYYTNRRQDDLAPLPPSNSGNCHHGYGREAVKHWGGACAYCGRDLIEDYESWLHLSVDHVVPSSVLKSWGKQRGNWVSSRANIVPCCRACNEFLNGYRVREQVPVDGKAFLALRDRVLQEKREKALKRHLQEKASYEQSLNPSAARISPTVCSPDALTQRVMRSRIARLPSDASFRC